MKILKMSVFFLTLFLLSSCESIDERIQLKMKYPGYTIYEAEVGQYDMYLCEMNQERFAVRKVDGEFEAVRFNRIIFSSDTVADPISSQIINQTTPTIARQPVDSVIRRSSDITFEIDTSYRGF